MRRRHIWAPAQNSDNYVCSLCGEVVSFHAVRDLRGWLRSFSNEPDLSVSLLCDALVFTCRRAKRRRI